MNTNFYTYGKTLLPQKHKTLGFRLKTTNILPNNIKMTCSKYQSPIVIE